MGDQTATQVYNDIGSVSGTVTISNQDQRTAGAENHAYTQSVQVTFRGASVYIQDITIPYFVEGSYPDASPPVGADQWNSLIFRRSALGRPLIAPVYDYVYFYGAGPWTLSTNYTITVRDGRLWRTETLNYGTGRDGKPVYADDRDLADEWLGIATRTYDVTFGPLNQAGTGGSALTNAVTITQIQLEADASSYPCEYANVTASWDEVAVNFSGMSKTYDNVWRARGSGGQLVFEALDGFDVQSPYYNSAWVHGAPRIIDWADFGVWERDGNLLGDLRVDGPFQSSYEHAASMEDWSTTP